MALMVYVGTVAFMVEGDALDARDWERRLWWRPRWVRRRLVGGADVLIEVGAVTAVRWVSPAEAEALRTGPKVVPVPLAGPPRGGSALRPMGRR